MQQNKIHFEFTATAVSSVMPLQVAALQELLQLPPTATRALVAKCPVLLACAADSLGELIIGFFFTHHTYN